MDVDGNGNIRGKSQGRKPTICGVAGFILGLIVGAVIVFVAVKVIWKDSSGSVMKEKSLPEGFLIGSATSAYQIEGAWNESGKGESIWDRYTHTMSRVRDGQTGDVACDSYHKYKEDIQMLKTVGFQTYRFSISWSRILPTGYANFTNAAGIKYYHDLIDEVLANGIIPMVTLYHWDLPQPLEDLGGWPNPIMADLFLNYSSIIFREYGEKVKWWITINEIHGLMAGYGGTSLAPGLGDHGVSDYLAAHTALRAHAKAYRLYEQVYKPTQKGKVGLSIYSDFVLPLDENSSTDKMAAERALQFHPGLVTHPIFSKDGDYPEVVRLRIDFNSKAEGRNSSRLPHFTAQEIQDLKGSFDFYALNNYYTLHATEGTAGPEPSRERDSGVIYTSLSPSAGGFRKLLNWVKTEYNNPPVFVTENGFNNANVFDDTTRLEEYHAFIQAMLDAINEDGCNIMGFTAWSLMDNFEWSLGFTAKFGLWHVDFTSPNRTRTMKMSAYFYKELLETRKLPDLPYSLKSPEISNSTF